MSKHQVNLRDESTSVERNRAILIGNNYVGSSCELHGCVNDQMNMYNWLKRIEPNLEVRFLSDVKTAPIPIYAVSNRANMIAAMQWLVSGATSQSRLFLGYSGHGSYADN